MRAAGPAHPGRAGIHGLDRPGIAAAILTILCAGSPFGAASAAPNGAGQRLAIVNHSTVARSAPSSTSARISVVRSASPLTGARRILPVIGTARDASGTSWLRVLLGGRPNGRSGWIKARLTAPATTGWAVRVDLSARRVIVHRDGRRARTFGAVVGASATPTPTGRFFVEEVVLLDPREPGAPYALALSARSEVLQEFAGGPGQIAFHGTRNVGGLLGTAVSHGCVRLSTTAVRWMARYIGPGTPVTVIR